MKYIVVHAIALVIGFAQNATDTGRTYASIRQVNFRNFSYPWTNDEEVPSRWTWMPIPDNAAVKLRAGRFSFSASSDQTGNQSPKVSLTGVAFGDLLGDGKEDAAVTLRYSSGGTANWSYLYLYQLKDGRPQLLSILESGSRGAGGLMKVAIASGSLTLDFADPEKQVGACCSEGYIRIRYHWDGSKFVQSASAEKGDLPTGGLAAPH